LGENIASGLVQGKRRVWFVKKERRNAKEGDNDERVSKGDGGNEPEKGKSCRGEEGKTELLGPLQRSVVGEEWDRGSG